MGSLASLNYISTTEILIPRSLARSGRDILQFPDNSKAKKTRASRGRGHFTFVCILWPPLTEKQQSGLPLLCIRLFPFQTIWYCLKELIFQENIWKEMNDTPGWSLHVSVSLILLLCFEPVWRLILWNRLRPRTWSSSSWPCETEGGSWKHERQRFLPWSYRYQSACANH